MKHGPVPWAAYRKVSSERDKWANAAPDPLYRVEADSTIVPLLNPELEYFSDSDLKCIDEEIEACRPLSFRELRTRSHDAAYKSATEDEDITVESIASAVAETPEERKILLEHLADA
jgi:hypothetical protein